MKTDGKKSINIDADVWRDLQRAKADTGKALHVLMREAWEARERQTQATHPSPVSNKTVYAPQNKHWHDELEIILNDAEERGGIEANLRWGAEAVRRKRHPKVANSGR